MKNMTIAIIAAVAGKKMTIGKDGELPWHFPSDLKFFRDKTAGHVVIMGRKTHDSIIKKLGKPLPGRRSIVMTRDENFRDERVEIAHDWDEAVRASASEEKIFVIGGASVFEQSSDHADSLLITHIEKEIDGDTFFPIIDKSIWQLKNEEILTENGVNLRFCEYIRY